MSDPYVERDEMARLIGYITLETAGCERLAVALMQALAPSDWPNARCRETAKATWKVVAAARTMPDIAPAEHKQQLASWVQELEALIDERHQWAHAWASFDVDGDGGWWLDNPRTGERRYQPDDALALLDRLAEAKVVGASVMYSVMPRAAFADLPRTDEGGDA
jgi:hypothetical protein